MPADTMGIPALDADILTDEQVNVLSLIPADQRYVFEDADLDADTLRFLADELRRDGTGKAPNGDGSFSLIELSRVPRPEPNQASEPSARDQLERDERGLDHRHRNARLVARQGGRAAPALLASVAASRARIAMRRVHLRLTRAVAIPSRARRREHRATRSRAGSGIGRPSRGSPSGDPAPEPEPPDRGGAS